MTPQELDVALKDIRRTRNLMIFLGFIPMIYVLIIVLTMILFSMVLLKLELMGSFLILPTVLIDTFIIMEAYSIRQYLTHKAKIGLSIYAIGIFGLIIILFFMPILKFYVLWLVLGVIYAGFISFVININIDSYQKATHVTYYALPFLVAIFSTNESILGMFGIATLIYPMLSSYLAVRWAGKEFFKLMNNEK